MRKSNLVKAMACFMAATMAITCVPSANVTNGVSIVAEAAVTVPKEIVNYDFESELEYTGKATIVEFGEGSNKSKVLNISRADEKTATVPNPLIGKTLTGFTVSFDFYALECTGHDVNSLDGLLQFEGTSGKLGVVATPGIYVTGAFWCDYNSYRVLSDKTHLRQVGVWKNITATVDETDGMAIYVDGVKVNPEEGANAQHEDATWTDIWAQIKALVTEENSTLAFGESPFWGTETGYLDNVKVYDTALSAEQVLATLPINPCADVVFENEDNATVTVGTPFDLKMELKGEKEGQVVTDTVTYSAIAATVAEGTVNGNERVLSVTPTTATKGVVTVTCGSIGKTYEFTAVENVCTSLTSSKGTSFTAKADQVTAFTVVAEAANKKLGLKDKIEMVTGSAIELTESYETGKNSLLVVAKIAQGANVFGFKCGDQTLTVTVTGSNDVVSDTTTTPTTPDEPTTPDNTDTTTGPAITTGSAITPEEPTTPQEPTTPTTPTTPEEPTTPDDTDNTATTTKKKVAKFTSVTANKGKKKVSGKVKIKATKKLVKKATVKVYVNGKKKATTTTKSTGKFSVTLSKKLKKGDKVKIVATKSTIKKLTKTVTVK